MAERASDWLKRRRIAAGLRKQSALAAALGVSRGAVGNWESNRGGPDSANVPALAAALGVTQAEVISAFGIEMRGELRTPMPPWATELSDRLSRIETQNAELARMLRLATGAGVLERQDRMAAEERAPYDADEPGERPGTP